MSSNTNNSNDPDQSRNTITNDEDDDENTSTVDNTTDQETEKTEHEEHEEVVIDEVIQPPSSVIQPAPSVVQPPQHPQQQQPSSSISPKPAPVVPPSTIIPSNTRSTVAVIPPPLIDAATEAAIPAPRKTSKLKTESCILGYGPTVPDKIFKKLRIKVKIPGGVRLKLELTKSVIISYIPDGSPAIGYLESGDWIKTVDGVVIKNRRKVANICRDKAKKDLYTIVFTVKRPLRNINLSLPKQINEHLPLASKQLPGYSYLLGNLAIFPGAKVGLRVKSFENKVYVSSLSHGSLAEVTFNIGDIILSVDDVPVTGVTEAHNMIQDALKAKKWVQVLIERPESKVALQRMNFALKAGRNKDIDPKMADDIALIVDKEMKRMRECGVNEPCKNILKDSGAKPVKSIKGVKFSTTSRETPILCDPVNMKILIKVPKIRPGSRTRLLARQSAARGPHSGYYRHLKTPNGIAYTEWIPTSSSSSSNTQRSSNSPASDNDK